MEKNIEDIEIILKSNAPYIRQMAKKYYITGGNEDDLFQEGMIGLLQAIKNYDETRGDIKSDAFKKFALMCAKRQMMDAIKISNSKKHTPLNNYISIHESYLQNKNCFEENDSTVFDPEEIVLNKVEKEQNTETIKLKLSDYEIHILDLYLDGNKQSEIAKMVDRNTKSIENTLQRIKNKLKKKGN